MLTGCSKDKELDGEARQSALVRTTFTVLEVEKEVAEQRPILATIDNDSLDPNLG